MCIALSRAGILYWFTYFFHYDMRVNKGRGRLSKWGVRACPKLVAHIYPGGLPLDLPIDKSNFPFWNMKRSWVFFAPPPTSKRVLLGTCCCGCYNYRYIYIYVLHCWYVSILVDAPRKKMIPIISSIIWCKNGELEKKITVLPIRTAQLLYIVHYSMDQFGALDYLPTKHTFLLR